MDLSTITDSLVADLQPLRFGLPVTNVYNPLEYARVSYDLYLNLYSKRSIEVVLLGMNPGPWGMAQTGVPFGEVAAVRDWLRIEAPVGSPAELHPKRPVKGFGCPRSEVSGRRLWGWAKKHFKTPERFFARFFVANYCPLLFIESSGRNRTPNNLRPVDKKPLLEICDLALRRTLQWLEPRYVVGVGRFAGERAEISLAGLDLTTGRITHPSPANPKANRGWDNLVTKELRDLGIRI
ncbi:MAG: single-stranded DNA-binding protein [Deltaproteobacteria bacterium]|jgi:single-strand selective monofunctional uracil DNA glycosylase